MQKKRSQLLLYRLLLLLITSAIIPSSFGQSADSTKAPHFFGGVITATNNGVSLLPTFSLGKPAVLFDLRMGKRLTFEPMFRFAMEGKPWTFIFWWRYKLVRSGRFSLNAGAHPALVFRTSTMTDNGVARTIIQAQRYVAMELASTYSLGKKANLGVYYLHSRGFEEAGTQSTHFVTLNSTISNVHLPGQLLLTINPQVYYLRMDERDGFYVTSTLTLGRRNFPFSIQSILNKTIQSNILGSKDLVWNISLLYSFGKQYAAVQ